jgi:UDP-N-acetylglucosamine 1-carboxyvinyltransferase
MEMLLTRYADMGMSILPIEDGLRVSCHHRLSAIDVATLPYPGIATDYKPLLVAMLATSDGTGIVTENLYPGRFRYIEELRKLGADVSVDGHHAVVRGRDHLVGATVVAPDIRAGAALVVAGLAAQGMTEIHDVHHIDRGYDDLVGRLANLGGSINRIG